MMKKSQKKTIKQRHWIQAKKSKEYNGTDEQKERLARAFDTMRWIKIKTARQVTVREKAAIDALGRVTTGVPTYFATSKRMEPHALVGLKARHSNGVSKTYCLVDGNLPIIVAADFYPKEEGEEPWPPKE